MNKKIACLLLASAMAVSMAACKSSDDGQPSTQPSASVDATASSTNHQEPSTEPSVDYSEKVANVVTIPEVEIDRSKYVTADPSDFKLDVCGGYIRTFINQDSCTEIHKYLGDDEYIIIPEEIDGRRIDSIGYECFTGTGVKGVIVPETIATLEGRAFAECEYLEEFVSGSNVKYMGPEAFSNCKALKNIVLNEGLIEVNNAFVGFDSMEYIKLPSTLENLLEYPFSRSTFKALVLPGSVKEIKTLASEADQMKVVVIGDGTEKLNFSAFSDMPNIEEVYIPDSVKTIDGSYYPKKTPNLVVRAPKGSVVEKFALVNNIPFKPI